MRGHVSDIAGTAHDDPGLPVLDGLRRAAALSGHLRHPGRRRLEEDDAEPLLLEAATRELRSEAAAAGVVAGVAQGLAARVLPRLAARGARAIPAARRVVDTVLVSLVRPALGLRSPTY